MGAPRSCAVAGTILLACTASAAGRAAASDRETADAYLRGYAAAILEREVTIEYRDLSVTDGVVHADLVAASGSQRELAAELLRTIDGVVAVEFVEPGSSSAPAAAGAPPPPESVRSASDPELGLLPRGELFRPLIADPRWPHTSVAYQRYFGEGELGQAGAPSFGESFALWRAALPDGGRWELGLQGGVFSIFDLEAESLDLVNADYMAGLTSAYQRGDFAALLRVFHQSSHLGDEFLLRDSVERVNLSYEVVDALLSYEFAGLARIYGGGGYIVHRDPADLAPGLLEGGIELVSPYTLAEGLLRPLAALDLKWAEESHWETDLSARAGFQLENPRLRSLRIQLLAEYYRGRSPNGQFFARDVEYAGFGIHLYF
jgi:hypothetical protein